MTIAPAGPTVEWTISNHALEQCAERGVALDELRAVLRRPSITQPSPHPDYPGTMLYTGHGIIAVVNEEMREVITVLINGETKWTWEEACRNRKSTLPAPAEERPQYRRMPESLRGAGNRNDPIPVSRTQVTNTLDFLHPVIREGVEAELARLGKTVKDVRILSKTRVEIL